MLCRLHGRGGGQSKKLSEAARLWARGLLLNTQPLHPDQAHHAAAPEQLADELDDALAAFGLQADGPVDAAQERCFYLWPCNTRAWGVFMACSTQWRMAGGMEGRRPTGIDYAALPAVLDLLGIPQRQRPGVFDGVRVCELAALQAWAEQARRNSR